MKKPYDGTNGFPMIGGADDPEIAERVAEMQERERNRARAPVAAAIGALIGNALGRAIIVLFYALVAVLMLAAFVGLWKVVSWLWGVL